MESVNASRPVPADSDPVSRRRALARVGAGAAALALAARAMPTAAQETSSETNEGIVRKLYAAYNAGAWEALAEVMAADAVDHDAVPGQAPGLAGITQQSSGACGSPPRMKMKRQGMLPGVSGAGPQVVPIIGVW